MRVVVEADGGSRGNPGPAAFGALVRDATTGAVIAERGETIGVATNNVAEYSGLIAGLELVAVHAPGAEVEVRMDSKLVVEQMAGRWQVKHPSMKPLWARARELAPGGTTWTWVPRAQNAAADALANAALDAEAAGRPGVVGTSVSPTLDAPPPTDGTAKNPLIGWRGALHGEPTTLILLRHGVTANTVRKLFCGSGGSDPGLIDEGRAQASRAAEHLAARGGVDAVVASPLRRTQETAGIVADRLGLPVATVPGLAEAAFGAWDGLGFADIMERWPEQMDAWLSSTSVAPPGGGESFDAVSDRVEAAVRGITETYPGQTVVAVSHVTPIKLAVRMALDAPMPVIHRMELAPASITTIAWWPDGTPSLRSFSVVP